MDFRDQTCFFCSHHSRQEIRYLLIGKRLWACLFLAIAALYPASSCLAAGCQTSTPTPSASFGTVTSIMINNNPQNTSISNAGVQCGGSLLNVLGAPGYIRGLVTTTNGAKLINGTGDSISYQIFADSGHTVPITPGTIINYYNATLLNLLGLAGSNNAPLRLYFLRPNVGGLNLSSGTYTDKVTVQWSWSICPLVSIGNICVGTPDTGTTTAIINLSLTITNDCIVAAPDLNFGSAPLVSAFSPVTQTINVQCTKGTIYTVGLSDGINALSGQRRLANGTNYMNYEIYQGSSGNTRWGSTSGQSRSSSSADVNPGAGTGSSNQGFVYTAKILPGPTPPAKVYTDTIIINIGF